MKKKQGWCLLMGQRSFGFELIPLAYVECDMQLAHVCGSRVITVASCSF